MKRNSLICTAGRAAALLLMTPTALLGFGWGQKGHDTTAAIATRHLTPRTAAAVRGVRWRVAMAAVVS